MSNVAILAGAAVLVFGLASATTGVALPGARLTASDVHALAESAIDRFGGPNIITPQQMVRIAWIESHFNPTAVRIETGIGDASVGLMQTLVGTAKDMERRPRYSRKTGVSFDDLFTPAISMHYAVAYFHWLRLEAFPGGATEEQLVRAYNGGPGGWSRAATLPYWQKYLRAIEEVG